MDRGEASSQYSLCITQTILLAKHNISIPSPKKITVYNAKQFNCDLHKDFCYQMDTEAAFASIYHP
jgi:hypothetical protein